MQKRKFIRINLLSKITNMIPSFNNNVSEASKRVKISVFSFEKSSLTEKEVSIEHLSLLKQSAWINVSNANKEAKEKICKTFNLHHLLTENILNKSQHSKLEVYNDFLLLTLHVPYFNSGEKIHTERLDLILGKNILLSFQERDILFNIKKELNQTSLDYILYLILYSLNDSYFETLEKFTLEIDRIEESLLNNPDQSLLHKVHYLKKNLLIFHKSVWPLREIINRILRNELNIIKKQTEIYLRDTYNNSVQIIETLETFMEMVSDIVDIYLSSMNNRLNEVMKVLTIISTIFIPLSFIVGIYGMNLKMPELEWKYSYLTIWIIMIIIAISMVFYFKKKKWF